MNRLFVAGIVLIALGVAALAYRQFTYKTNETVFEIGPIKASAERVNRVPLPAILGWAMIGGGAGVLVYSGRKP